MQKILFHMVQQKLPASVPKRCHLNLPGTENQHSDIAAVSGHHAAAVPAQKSHKTANRFCSRAHPFQRYEGFFFTTPQNERSFFISLKNFYHDLFESLAWSLLAAILGGTFLVAVIKIVPDPQPLTSTVSSHNQTMQQSPYHNLNLLLIEKLSLNSLTTRKEALRPAKQKKLPQNRTIQQRRNT